MYKDNVINACLSEDMDLLVFGCKKMIKFKSNSVVEYDLDYITKSLNITSDQFIELCILFGCDYLKPLLRLKPDEIYNKYINSNSIYDVLDSYNYDIVNKYVKDFNLTKNLFINKDRDDSDYDINIKLSVININQLNDFIDDNCTSQINDNINYEISHINELIKNKKFGI